MNKFMIMFWTAIVMMITMTMNDAISGEFYKNDNNSREGMFNGMIQMGDAMKLYHAHDNSLVYLSSPGGNAWEGLTMGYIIKGKNLHVSTYEGQKCESACASAALMGKTIHGVYGFHAPYPVGYTPSEQELKYIRNIFVRYMQSTGKLTDTQIDKIMNTSSNELIYFTWDMQ